MTVVNINENNFEEEVVKSSLPCLVDFWRNGVDHARIWHQY